MTLSSGGAIDLETDDQGRFISATSAGHRVERHSLPSAPVLLRDLLDGEGVERHYDGGVLEEIQVLEQFIARYEQSGDPDRHDPGVEAVHCARRPVR